MRGDFFGPFIWDCLLCLIQCHIWVFQILFMLLKCMINILRNYIMVDNFIHSPLRLTRMTLILDLRETVPGFAFINYHYLNAHNFYM